MLIEHEGHARRIHPAARIASDVTPCGDVEGGPGCCVGFGAVPVAESGPVRPGADRVVIDTAVPRGVRGAPLASSDRVPGGPRAHPVGCKVEGEASLATDRTMSDGARIGRGAQVWIGGIVHPRTVPPPGATVPPGRIAVGDPVHILPPERHDAIRAVQKPLDAPRRVFGVERPPEGQSYMPEVMPRYARALARRHAGDRVIEPGEGEARG